MRTGEFDYDLPEAAIATRGAEPRDSARLLVDQGPGRAPDHRRVADLPTLVGPGDVVVVNETRVLSARVRWTRPTGGRAEVLLLEPVGDGWWEALVRPSAKLRPGTVAAVAADLAFELGDDLGEGRRRVRPVSDDLTAALDVHGEMPLPPYLGEVRLDDPDRYQTVFARRAASAAAPTAGLHLTERVLAGLVGAGAEVHPVELVVGLDTFKPIAADRVEDHQIHTERYRVPEATWDAVGRARRVVAVGTTSVRALESVAATGCLEGRTDLFVRRGVPVRIVDVLMTNFHLPRSSLLVLLDAFMGPRWRDLYEAALADGYRFLSFGDAMLARRAEG